jgi:hypothetical protein
MGFGYWARPWHFVVIRTGYFETACGAALRDEGREGLPSQPAADRAPLCRRCVAAIVRREIARDASVTRAPLRESR